MSACRLGACEPRKGQEAMYFCRGLMHVYRPLRSLDPNQAGVAFAPAGSAACLSYLGQCQCQVPDLCKGSCQ